MVDFDVAAFMKEFALSRSFCAKVFGVSERTVTRWRRLRKMPAPAVQLARSIERQCAPWNAGFSRGYRIGVSLLAWEWREALFAPAGGAWQSYRPPAERAALRAAIRRDEQRAAERAEQRRRARLAAGRKAAATRKARAAMRDRASAPAAVVPPRRGRRWSTPVGLGGYGGAGSTPARDQTIC